MDFLNDKILEQCTQDKITNQVEGLDKMCKNYYELPTQYERKEVYKQGYKYHKINYKVHKPYRRRNFKFNKYKFKDYKKKYNNYDKLRLWRKIIINHINILQRIRNKNIALEVRKHASVGYVMKKDIMQILVQICRKKN
jgi:hypothetical protein